MRKEIICTICPMGCAMTAEGTEEKIEALTGYTCKRGEVYGRQEFLHPVRILTTTVKVAGMENHLLPVRSEQPIPKELLMPCMEEIKKISVTAPVSRYDVIIPNICGSGIAIVATGTV